MIQKLAALDDFSEANIEQAFAEVLEEHGIADGQTRPTRRVALTGSTVSPGIHEVIAVLGKERTIAATAQTALDSALAMHCYFELDSIR